MRHFLTRAKAKAKAKKGKPLIASTFVIDPHLGLKAARIADIPLGKTK